MVTAPLHLVLTAQPQSVPAARNAVRAQLIEWDMAHLVDDAALLVTELATNAVLHARGQLRITLRLLAGTVRLEVGDDSPRLPTQRRPSTTAGTGRGLALVEALSSDWGVESGGGEGKVVWALLRAGS